MSEWAGGLGRKGIGISHVFVLRLTVERRAGRDPVTWLRLQEADRGDPSHFKDVPAAVQALRQRLEAIVAGSDGEP